MHSTSDRPTGLRHSSFMAIEVRIWEIFVARSRHRLGETLSAYSLDGGPQRKDQKDPERIIYRFMKFDWDRVVKDLLAQHSVPFEILSHFEVTDPKRTKPRVCVVEDDLDILFAVNMILEGAGYDVVLFHCARPLMEAPLPHADLFLIDKYIPDGDGFEICRAIRNRNESKDTPLIIMTAGSNLLRKAISAGANEVLEKPIGASNLLKTVAKYTVGF